MNAGAIIAATLLVAAVGLFIGIFLGVAGKKFAVETDEREVKIREALPGNNCGGCGYPGCDGLAAAIAKGEAPVNGCPVGGDADVYKRQLTHLVMRIHWNTGQALQNVSRKWVQILSVLKIWLVFFFHIRQQSL